MPSSRETFKSTLFKAMAVLAGQSITSNIVDAEGRLKTTFIVSSDVACQLTVEWSYNGTDAPWIPLTSLINLPIGAGANLRVTIDDCMTKLRIRVDGFGAPATVSGWVVSL
jgi:hypothetical protein